MGWWEQNDQGQSFCEGTSMYWGDRVADIVDDAIENVVAAFIDGFGRPPSKEEIRAGFNFSLACYDPNDKMWIKRKK